MVLQSMLGGVRCGDRCCEVWRILFAMPVRVSGGELHRQVRCLMQVSALFIKMVSALFMMMVLAPSTGAMVECIGRCDG